MTGASFQPRDRVALALILIAAGIQGQVGIAAEIPFAPAATVSASADGARDVVAADIDRDGDIDLVSASFDDDTIAWYENDGSQNFQERVVTTSADGARAVAVGDLDGDGDPDLASASFNDDTIAWYENSGASPPTFTAHVITEDPDPGIGLEGFADGAVDIALADFDRDGDLDLAFSARGADFVAWYENDGTPADGGWISHTIRSGAPDLTESIHPADVDRDGDVDLLATVENGDLVVWYDNDGTPASGTWTQRGISDTAEQATSVSAGDLDGDGDLDVLATLATDGAIAWYESDGTPADGGWTEHQVTASAPGARAAIAADLDGDGDLDVLTAAETDGTIAWHESDGTPADGGWTRRVISASVSGAWSAAAADVDGDGDLDVLSAAATDDTVAWHENLTIHRSAVFPLDQVISTAARGALRVLAADLDGDGDPDAVAGYATPLGDSGKIAWFENLGPDAGDGPCSAVTSACFGAEQVISTAITNVWGVHTADLDADGDLDALSASFSGNQIAWYENLGPDEGDGPCSAATSACFGLQQVLPTVWSGAFAVATGDLDGDGDLDVVSTFAQDDRIAWHQNLGPDDGDGPCSALTSACFESGRSISSAAAGARGLAVGDLDGDGDLDVASASSDDNKLAWYENLGPDAGGGPCMVATPACFGPQQIISTASIQPLVTAAADLDADGDLDLILASRLDLSWYENLGPDSGSGPCAVETSACFGSRRIIANTPNGTSFVVAADLDGDGDLDALSASFADDTIAWYENLGADDGNGPCSPTATSACFGPPQVITTLADGSNSVFVADVDRDGDLDALSASAFDDTIAWYENRGGQFALATTDRAQRVMLGGQVEDVFSMEVTHRGRAGDTDLELATIELLFELNPGSPLSSGEANALIQEVRLYLDDGSGAFEPAGDTLVSTTAPLALVAGVQTLLLPDGDTRLQVAFGTPRTYFVVLEIQPDAASQSPASFLVTHLTESSSSAEDRDHDIPLILEPTPDLGTSLIDTFLASSTCWAPFDLNLAGATVSSTLTCQAGEDLRAGGGFSVVTGGDLTLRAGRAIELEDDFDVQGGALTTENDPTLLP